MFSVFVELVIHGRLGRFHVGDRYKGIDKT